MLSLCVNAILLGAMVDLSSTMTAPISPLTHKDGICASFVKRSDPFYFTYSYPLLFPNGEHSTSTSNSNIIVEEEEEK